MSYTPGQCQTYDNTFTLRGQVETISPALAALNGAHFKIVCNGQSGNDLDVVNPNGSQKPSHSRSEQHTIMAVGISAGVILLLGTVILVLKHQRHDVAVDDSSLEQPVQKLKL